jgi:hypothetical protein
MSFSDLWDSIEKLSRLITVANWGIALTLLVAFACTVVVIKAGNRKDELTGIEDLQKAKQIADTTKLAGEANEQAGIANERAAELEKENLILQQKLANRRITKAQHDVLVAFLSKKRGRIIIETMSDSESGLFAADFLKTFTDSGWEIAGKHFPLAVVWTGLILYNSADPDALTVAKALKLAGIPFSIGTEQRDKATIMVGGKPPMF